MTALNRKLFRDLYHLRGQAVAVSLVIACGVATFIMSFATMESLRWTQETYYQRYRFAQVFAPLKRAPDAVERRIAEIPGVAQVETRVVADVTVDVEGFREPVTGRLISLPEQPAAGLNQLYLRRGRFAASERSDEALVSEAFAVAHNLQPGDAVRAVINGRRQRLTLVGVVLSPEYVMQIRGGDFLPDTKRFGVFWMEREALANAFNMDGAFNDVALTLTEGSAERRVIDRLDVLLRPYGGIGAYGRGDQLSNKYVTDELRQLRGMGMIVPSIFLAVATFLFNVVLSRLVSTQREQIAALKAFGYTRHEIAWHYLKLALVIAAVGEVLGAIVGTWMGRHVTEMYTIFYRFPVFTFQLHAGVVLWATLLTGGAAVLGALVAVRRAGRLPPAEAMRPTPPAVYRRTIVERAGLGWLLSPASRMILRNLERRPWKAGISVLGIALAAAVLVLGSFMEDALDYLIEFQFVKSQRQDVTVAFVEPASPQALYELQRLPGVRRCEPFRSLPTRLRSGNISRRIGIMGLPKGGELFRLLDVHERPASIPREGLFLSEKLAEILGVRLGDSVTVEVLEGRQPVHEATVTGLVSDFGGLNAYMDLEAIHRLMQEGEILSGAFFTVDGNRLDELYATLKETPRVSSVSIKQASLQSFRDTIAENLLRMRTFNVLFASVIAFGVVYNSARISLSERSRELATLRVVGFTRLEISGILLGELAVLTLAAIPCGLAIGYAFAAISTLALNTEMYRIPLVVDRSTFGFAAVVVLAAALFSALVVRRRLDHLDLIAVLKTKE
jgi:putative ABC transport system permease protein